MHPLTLTALIALLLAPAAPPPTANFRWQRAITPPKSNPATTATQAACVVLDASTFSNAEPGLTDLRLFQDGAELPYLVEESFDQRALDRGTTPPDDRSLYELSRREPLSARPSGSQSTVVRHNSRTHQLLLPEEIDPYAGFFTAFRLPARVPVERLRVEPAPDTPESITISASPVADPHQNEAISAEITPTHPVMPVTLGANLQSEARIGVGIDNTDRIVRSVILEMRRRSLCYQPRSASPLTLFLGNPGLPAVSYSFTGRFSAIAATPLASLGPLLPNPNFHPPLQPHHSFLQGFRLRIASFISVIFLLFTGNRLLHTKRNPASGGEAGHL